MLSEPLSITITGFNGGSAISLPRVEQKGSASTYRSSDGLYELIVSQSYEGQRQGLNARRKAMCRLNIYVVATNPLESTKNVNMRGSLWFVWDIPAAGFSTTNMLNMYLGLTTLLEASTNQKATQIVGGEV